MSNDPSQLKQQQKETWTAAAPAWEQNDAWLEETLSNVTRWLCDAARISAGQQALDLACGAGQPSVMIAQRVLPGGKVVATDLSPAMVAATRRVHERLGHEHVEVREMDAENLAFPDQSFEIVTCRFGLMFCPDPARAIREVHRVLRPGGRFATAVWDVPERNPFFTSIGAVCAKYFAMPPPDPALPGMFRLAAPGELAAMLRTAGFHDVDVQPMQVTFEYTSPEHYWELQSQIAGPLRAAIKDMTPATLAELRADVVALGAAHSVDGGRVRFDGAPLVAVALR